MDGQAQTNMPPQLLRSWGHKNFLKIIIFTALINRSILHRHVITKQKVRLWFLGDLFAFVDVRTLKKL